MDTATTTATGCSDDAATQQDPGQGCEEEPPDEKADEEKTMDNEVTNAIDVFSCVSTFHRVFSPSGSLLIAIPSL